MGGVAFGEGAAPGLSVGDLALVSGSSFGATPAPVSVL